MSRRLRCSKCDDIKLAKFDHVTTRDVNFLFAILHRTRESFYQSVSEGCEFCSMLSTEIKPSELDPICEDLQAFVVLKCHKDIQQRRAVDGKFRLFVRTRMGSAHLEIIRDLSDDYRQVHQTSVGPNNHTGSRANLNLAKLWLDHCLKNSDHKICSQNVKRKVMPTRLVNVEDVRRPFLEVEKHTDADVYIALSYCWGDGKKYLTLESNLKKHRDEIPVDKLPKTFQETILAAHQLGYKYLWTDALCIIQDSPADLASEIQNMCDIYRYADLTICAERAKSSNDGLFGERDATGRTPVELDLGFPVDGDRHQTKRVTVNRDFSGGVNYLKDRGWIFQEEILSSRLLFFGKQLAWRCKSCEATETDPTPKEMDYSRKRTGVEVFRQQLFARFPDDSDRDYCDLWYRMVEQYGPRKLTSDADVLKALEGLAQAFGEAHGVTYADGLWLQDVLRGLGWVTTDTLRVPSRDRLPNLAPTWSWASLGKVGLSYISLKADGVRTTSSLSTPSSGRGTRPTNSGTSSLRPFERTRFVGRVDHKLEFRAVLVELFIRHADELVSQKLDHDLRRALSAEQKKRKGWASRAWMQSRHPAAVSDHADADAANDIGEAFLDTANAATEPSKVLALPLFAMTNLDIDYGVCLLLKEARLGEGDNRAAAAPQAYCRIGLAVVSESWVRQRQSDDSKPDQEFVLV